MTDDVLFLFFLSLPFTIFHSLYLSLLVSLSLFQYLPPYLSLSLSLYLFVEGDSLASQVTTLPQSLLVCLCVFVCVCVCVCVSFPLLCRRDPISLLLPCCHAVSLCV